MYLEYFNFKELPFTLTPNTDYFCDLSSHRNGLNVVLLSLRNGEGFIKIIGEVGAGKTLLCRILLEKLQDSFTTAYIPNPDLKPDDLLRAVAAEIGLATPLPDSMHVLLQEINLKLLSFYEKNKPVVLLIDEAQVLSAESLEALRLLTNLETKQAKLLQIVLLGQPELDQRLNQPNLRQLKQRISFSYTLVPMTYNELNNYIFHRLAKAGHTFGTLFNRKARHILYRKTQGIPRLVNILCHKALMVAYGCGARQINGRIMLSAARDTEALNSLQSSNTNKSNVLNKIIAALIISIFLGFSLLFALQYHLLWIKSYL